MNRGMMAMRKRALSSQHWLIVLMSSAAEPMVLTQEQTDAFTALVLRYLDGACTAAEVRDLQDRLVAGAVHREVFVRTCHMLGCLHESYAPKRTAWQAKTAAPADQADPRADTVVHELSPDDTVHPLPQAPKDRR